MRSLRTAALDLALALLLTLTATTGLAAEAPAPEGLTHAFLEFAAPQIQAAIAGVYGAPRLYESARVLSVKPVAGDDRYQEVVVQVETFHGAHNPLGLDTITFKVSPGKVVVGSVKHKEHPALKEQEPEQGQAP